MRFEEYVQERGPGLLRLAHVLTGDPHRAEDLTQTALMGALRNWRKVSKAQSPDAYVRKMLVNANLDWHRRRSSTELPTDLGVHEPPPVPDAANDAVVSRAELRQLLSTLSPRNRTVLVLRYYLDLDDDAIADTLGVAPSTVRATASRALAALRDGDVVETTKERS